MSSRYKFGHRVIDGQGSDIIYIAPLNACNGWCVVFDIHAELIYPTMQAGLKFHARKNVFRNDNKFIAHFRKLWKKNKVSIISDMEGIVHRAIR